MTADEWVAAFAAELGAAAPAPDETNAILRLAGVAAHASERKAAPVACFVAARVGVPLDVALAAAKRVGGEADGA